jgi:hypothetical protein
LPDEAFGLRRFDKEGKNDNGPGVIPSRRVVSADYWSQRLIVVCPRLFDYFGAREPATRFARRKTKAPRAGEGAEYF